MTTQTEAERLADALDVDATNGDMGRKPDQKCHKRKAAAELRRLVSFNQQLMDEVARLQKREWVGLTDGERRSIREWQRIQEELGPVWAPMMLYLYEAIEAKLKEKNT